MFDKIRQRTLTRLLLTACICVSPLSARAGGGYFLLGYGPFSEQMAGTSTAVGFDAFAAASNPAKLTEAGNRLDAGMQLFMPYRRVSRSGAAQAEYDFSSTSRHGIFYLPDGGFAHRLGDHSAWGITVYGNGGLDTDFRNTNNVPGSNKNPAACGNQPANFFFGCGRIGFNLSQVIIAPSVAYEYAPHQSVGIAPLLLYQRIDIFGFQAFQPLSERPDAVTNNGYDPSIGAGARVGWFGRVLPWLDAGAAYSTKVYATRFKRYQGIIADQGRFDIPANYSVGLAARPIPAFTVAVDVQRIEFHEIPTLSNSTVNSLISPPSSPFGSANGTGFGWRNTLSYRLGLAYVFSPRFTGRLGYAYGRRADNESINSVSLNMFAPEPYHQVSAGATARLSDHADLQVAYQRWIPSHYAGPSATSLIGVGGTEESDQSVTVIYLAATWRM